MKREHPKLAEGIAQGLAQRYLKEDGEATSYEDVRSGEGRRRLAVCARDLYRLVDRFGGTAAAELEAYRLLERLLREQCHVGKDGDGRPCDDDDDAGEGKAPIALKEPKEVRSDSLQSPHDPDVTYSGHKGKGYEVQVAETCDEEQRARIITHVEVTPSSGSDAAVTVPIIDALAEREIRPGELTADTSYGSGRNAFEAERRGTELVSPVGGAAPKAAEGAELRQLTAADFVIDVTGSRATICPAGHEPWRSTRTRRRRNGWRSTSPARSASPARCVLREGAALGRTCLRRTWCRSTSSVGGEPRRAGSSESATPCAPGSKEPTLS